MRISCGSAIWPVIATCALHPVSAAAWTTDLACELSNPPPPGITAFSLTSYSTAHAASGAGSCQMGITAGSDGWGTFGAVYAFPSNVTQGSSIWLRASLFIPPGFDVTTDDGFLKFLRIHTANASGGNEGYHDLLISTPGNINWSPGIGNWTAPYIYNFEGAAKLFGVGTDPADDFVTGAWETYEINVVFDSTPKSSGGNAEVRIWKNNALLLDNTDQPTLVSSTDYADAFYLFTYWNGNAPATQSLYVDDMIISTDTPSNRDAAGNPCLCAPTPTGN